MMRTNELHKRREGQVFLVRGARQGLEGIASSVIQGDVNQLTKSSSRE